MMDPFDSFRRPFPVVEDEDPFAQVKLAEEIQRAQQGAQASIPAPMREPYEEEDPAIAQQKKEQLLKRIAAAHMQDKMNLAGTNATLAATKRMPGASWGTHGPDFAGQDGNGLTPQIDRSLVADAMRQKQMEDSMTLNPGMNRFLKNQPEEGFNPKPSLEDNLAQQRQGAYKEGTMESGTQVTHMPDGSIALKGVSQSDGNEPGIQLANMSPEDQAEQEFDRKVQADAMRQRLAERDKRENIRKGTVQAERNARMNGGFGGGANGGNADYQQQMAIEMVQRGGPAFIPLAAEMMKARNQQTIEELRLKAATELKKADWGHDDEQKRLDREHTAGMRSGDQEFQLGIKGQEIEAADKRSAREIEADDRRSERDYTLRDRIAADEKAARDAELAAKNDPKRAALGASINSDGDMTPEQAEDFLTGKGNGQTGKLKIPAEPATDDRMRSALSTIRSQGSESFDTPEEQEQLRQELLRQGITSDDLRRFQGGDYGDPSWYEWWDRGVAPYLSSGSSALIDERHANTPLLQALIGAQ